MNIIEKIEKLKQERGWTDYELAQQSMITQSTIASIKSRKSPPKIDTLQALCNAFGITLAQFFLEDEQIEILSEQEKILLENFRHLPYAKQKALLDLLTK
ncbi:MAG: helix-turn-helix domain-containing protein [Clostridia bacterium]|nr:helix-turn-helix domain-containing protein [Clostridia bacterium]